MDYKCMLLVVLASHIGALKSEVCAFDSFFSCLHLKIGSNHSMVVVYNYTEWANKIVVWFISLGRQIEQQKVELLVQKLLQFALLFVLFCCFYIYNNSNNNTHTHTHTIVSFVTFMALCSGMEFDLIKILFVNRIDVCFNSVSRFPRPKSRQTSHCGAMKPYDGWQNEK